MLRNYLSFAFCAVAALILYAPISSAQQLPSLQCWEAGFTYRNDSNTSGNVTVLLQDSVTPQHSYSRTFTLHPTQQRDLYVYGLIDPSSGVYSSATADDNLTFVAFGDFQQTTDYALCVPPAPAVGSKGLALLGFLLVVLATFGFRLLARKDLAA